MEVANGPATHIAPAMRRRLLPTATVLTVGAMRSGGSGQRTIARLTPSSLKDTTAISAMRAIANVPNSSGPSIRASAIPMKTLANFEKSVFAELHARARAGPGLVVARSIMSRLLLRPWRHRSARATRSALPERLRSDPPSGRSLPNQNRFMTGGNSRTSRARGVCSGYRPATARSARCSINGPSDRGPARREHRAGPRRRVPAAQQSGAGAWGARGACPRLPPPPGSSPAPARGGGTPG